MRLNFISVYEGKGKKEEWVVGGGWRLMQAIQLTGAVVFRKPFSKHLGRLPLTETASHIWVLYESPPLEWVYKVSFTVQKQNS